MNDESFYDRLTKWVCFGSLRRTAVVQEMGLRGHGLARGVCELFWARLKAVVEHRLFVVILLTSVGLLYLPIFQVSFGPFGEIKEASEFLRTLWQVEAAALALSLTVIVFAFELFLNSGLGRYGGSLRGFARRTHLVHVFQLGVAGLVVNGLVLAHVGNQAPMGWAALVASLVSGAGVVLLPWVLTATLKATDGDALDDHRQRTLTRAVNEHVRSEVIKNVAMRELRELADRESIRVEAFLAQAIKADQTASSSPCAGVVTDIDLRRLRKLARRIGGQQISLRVDPLDSVQEGETMIVLPLAASVGNRKLAGKIVTTGVRKSDSQLHGHLDGLDEESLAAIRGRQPKAYGKISDAYVATLMEFSRSWRRYNQDYTTGIANGLDFFPIGPLPRIERDVYEQLRVAVVEADRELLETVAFLPYRVALEATGLNASGLVTTMLKLYPSMYTLGAASGGELGDLLKRSSWTDLSNFLRYTVRPRLKQADTRTAEDAGELATQAYAQFNQLLKRAVELGDTDTIRDADTAWTKGLRYLDPESSPNPTAADPETQLLQIADDLDQRRQVYRFGLCLWAWRKREQIPNWMDSFTHFAGHFGSLSEIAKVADHALNFDEQRHSPWINWILEESGDGAYSISIQGDVMRTFAALAIMRTTNDDNAGSILGARWMSWNREEIEQVLDAVASDPLMKTALMIDDAPTRTVRIKRLLRTAAEQWSLQEAASLRDASPMEEQVEEFRRLVAESLAESRLVPALFVLANALIEVNEPHARADELLRETWMRKELFVKGGRMVGLDMVASDFGHNCAINETAALLEMISRVDETELPNADLRSALNGAVKTLTDQGFSPSVIFVPVNWRASEAMDLAFLTATVPPSEWHMGERAAESFKGFYASLPVFQLHDVPDEYAYVVDLKSFAQAYRWPLSEDQRVSLEFFTEPSARTLVEAGHARSEGKTDDQLINRIRSRARARVQLDVSVEAKESAACRRVEIPEGLRA